ncbi:MAG TPA: MurR/RpiR family transcriptional regulator [Terrimicrobiaceae bacterium]|nr:MurR/RpiR family transcriptional regulator [Terrimicrobiaceae bacterium]
MTSPPPSVDELIERIAAAYETLPRQLKSIATYIEQNRSRVMMDRVGEIAEACQVHPSAVVRFSKHFGFSGFSELQAIFRRAYTEQVGPVQNYQQRVRKLIKSNRGRLRGSEIAREFIEGSRHGLHELETVLDPDAFDAALDLLVKAKTIYIAGVRRSFAPASYLAYALQHTRKRVILAPGLGGMYREQISSIRKGDVLVAISFLPYGKETQYCVRMAHHNKASTLVITDSQLSALARFASVLLVVKEGNAFGFRSLTNTICLCQALFISLAYRLELNLEPSEDDPIEVP